LDPNFASAYAQLADAYDGMGEAELASRFAQKAFDRRDQVSQPEKLSFTSKYYFYTLGDLDKELQTYQVWEQIYPRSWMPWNDASNSWRNLGNHERALTEGQEALRLNPNAVNPYLNVGYALLCLGRNEEARRTGELALSRGLDVAPVHLLIYHTAFLDHDTKAMQAQISPWLGGQGKEAVLDVLLAQSSTEAYFGRLRSSLSFSTRAFEMAQRNKYGELTAQVRVIDALRRAEFGDVRGARQAARSALALSAARYVKLFASLALARAGDVNRAQALLDELDRNFPSNILMQRYWLPTIQASIELGRRNPSKALNELQRAAFELADTPTLFDGNLYPTFVRGQAYLEVNQGDNAAAEFQKFLDHRSIAMNSPLGALAYLGLARAYLLQGNGVMARKGYQDFLALWKDADADVPILKEARAEYAKLQ
jgi:tetratricopeptide (TPR) repeat protein